MVLESKICYQHRNRHTDLEDKLMVIKGEGGERDKLGVWD